MSIYVFLCEYLTLYMVSCRSTQEYNYKNTILNTHNAARNTLAGGSVSAGNMNELLWDQTLADLATTTASLCNAQHPPVTTANLDANLAKFQIPSIPMPLGENLGFSTINSPIDAIESITNSWVQQGEFYEYGRYQQDDKCTATLNGMNGCDDFIQMIWAKTRYVGCGYAECSGTQYICLYYTAPIAGQTPYNLGVPCSSCDGDRDRNCPSGGYNTCGGGVDSRFYIHGFSAIDDCDDGLGGLLSNACNVITTTTTKAPTTLSPTTRAPTTSSPTTRAPTTPAPTEPVIVSVDQRCCACAQELSPAAECAVDPDCSNAICEYDEFCCLPESGGGFGWDYVCGQYANVPCGNDGITSCCECTTATPGTPGCAADTECAQKICAVDGKEPCCEESWGPQCSKLAQMTCNVITAPQETTNSNSDSNE